jgi:hypothetical protein
MPEARPNNLRPPRRQQNAPRKSPSILGPHQPQLAPSCRPSPLSPSLSLVSRYHPD